MIGNGIRMLLFVGQPWNLMPDIRPTDGRMPGHTALSADRLTRSPNYTLPLLDTAQCLVTTIRRPSRATSRIGTPPTVNSAKVASGMIA